MYLVEPNLNNRPRKNDGRKLLFAVLILILVIFIMMFTGCVTEKQRAKICAACQHSDSVHVTKKDTTTYQDGFTFISQGGDTVFLPTPCDTVGNIKPIEIIKKKQGIITHLKATGKVIECDCADDSLKAVITHIRADHYAEINSVKSEFRLLQCTREHRNGWDTFCHYVTWGFIISVVLVLIVFFLKHYFGRL